MPTRATDEKGKTMTYEDCTRYTTDKPLEFTLKTDAKGTTRARYYSFRAHRSFGISLAVVRKLEAEGRAVEVVALVSDANFLSIYAGV